jgi:hypothetical protein
MLMHFVSDNKICNLYLFFWLFGNINLKYNTMPMGFRNYINKYCFVNSVREYNYSQKSELPLYNNITFFGQSVNPYVMYMLLTIATITKDVNNYILIYYSCHVRVFLITMAWNGCGWRKFLQIRRALY